MEHGNYMIWSYMRCFDHDKEDYGIEEYLQKIGRKPEGFCALVVHPDMVHQHPGMEKEHLFPPHLCGCRKDPRYLSEQTYREFSWTNYQIRGLTQALHKRGMKLFISMMGYYYLDLFHEEWLGQHKELLMETTTRTEELVCLKRLKDGSFYEDFLIAQLKKVMQDYHMDGVHLCDRFSPLSEPLADGDYSTDMVEQFMEHTGIILPQNLMAHLGEDSAEQKTARQQWIWYHQRESWIRFYDWRWTVFYQKLCRAMHEIGCQVSTLGMYVSDPLRSMYSMGTNISHLTKAGVDFFTPNLLPTSVKMNSGRGESKFVAAPMFHRYMAYVTATKGLAPNAKLYQMLGIRDEEEEWDVLHHAPNQLERDLFTAMSYQLITKEGVQRCIERPFVTIGDSIEKQDWDLVNQYMDAIDSMNIKQVISPVLYWSDTANEKMLAAHIKTRRPSAALLQAYLQSFGAYCGGVVRSDDLDVHQGPLFIPDFDLLSEEEQSILLGKKLPLLAIAPSDYDISGLGATLCIKDRFSTYPQQAFLLHVPAPKDMTPLEELLAQDDKTPNLPSEERLDDSKLNVMYDMYFQKVTKGFQQACAMLFRHMDSLSNPFTSDAGLMVHQEDVGTYIVLVYNHQDEHYQRSLVTANRKIDTVTTLSSFPYRPVLFVDQVTSPGETRVVAKRLDSASGNTFQLKIKPAGVSVFRIALK
ncbi:MAG: hypothetical protein E7399_02835 [Ruminococcaceae bacterium]|nr:hypothetical protein [Oscillospiraceae bacterium]